RPDVEKKRILLEDLGGGQLLQGAHVVENIDAASVRTDNQIVIAGVNDDVVDPDSGHSGHELFPLFAAVDRDEETKLSARIQQVLVLGVLTDHVDVADRRQVAADRRPGGAVVTSYVDIRLEIIEAMAVDGEVARGGIVAGRLDPRDVIQLARLVG